MIKSIKIRNFQALSNLELELSPRVNVIHGQSDSGKTAVIRALNWVIDNKPNGFEFRRDPRKNQQGKKPLGKKVGTECSIVIEEGEITRLRNEATGEDAFNGYILPDDSEREALKGEVPEEVSRLLNISRYNIQMQHDPIFMLTDSPGEVARKINEITRMDVIDVVRKRCDGIISEAKTQMDLLSKQIDEEQEQLNQLGYLEDVNKRVTELEQLDKQLKAVEIKLQSIGKLINEIEVISYGIEVLEDWLSAEEPLVELLELIEQYNNVNDRHSRLTRLVQEIKVLEEQIEDDEYIIKLKPQIDNLTKDLDRYYEIEDKIDDIYDVICEIEGLTSECVIIQKRVLDSQSKYIELIREAGECPVCGSPIEDEYIQQHLGVHV